MVQRAFAEWNSHLAGTRCLTSSCLFHSEQLSATLKGASLHAAIVIGGTGKDSLARTILLGHSISYVVLRNATMPVLLVGARNAPECPEILKSRINLAELPSLAKFDAIAAAA